MASGVSVVIKRKGLDALRKKMNRAKGYSVSAGVQDSQRKGDGDLTNEELAVIHEYGTSTIPARPFLGPTFTENADKYATLLGRLSEKFNWQTESVDDLERALALIGMQMVNDTRAKIRKGIDPALSPKTIARKGSSKPLIDSGQLINSITYKVRKGNE